MEIERFYWPHFFKSHLLNVGSWLVELSCEIYFAYYFHFFPSRFHKAMELCVTPIDCILYVIFIYALW